MKTKTHTTKPAPAAKQKTEVTLDGASCCALSDTRIETAGVMRCCLSSVGHEYDHLVKLGMRSRCEHCGEWFTLVEPQPGWKYPKWTPDRFIQHNAEHIRHYQQGRKGETQEGGES